VWTWVHDPPMTFTILSGRWVGNTGCPAKSSTKGLGVPQNRRRKVVTLSPRHFSVPVIPTPKQKKKCSVRRSSVVLSFLATEPIFTGTRTQDIFFRGSVLCFCNHLVGTNNFGLGAVLLSCLVSKIQEPPSPGFEHSTLFQSFDPSKIFSWFQVISIPSLVKIGCSVLEH
jgi:hypothetical protein